jgi:osmotically-inducible protein OsmY
MNNVRNERDDRDEWRERGSRRGGEGRREAADDRHGRREDERMYDARGERQDRDERWRGSEERFDEERWDRWGEDESVGPGQSERAGRDMRGQDEYYQRSFSRGAQGQLGSGRAGRSEPQGRYGQIGAYGPGMGQYPGGSGMYGGQQGHAEMGQMGMGRFQRHPELVGKGPKGYQRADERVHEEVCERLAQGYLDASEIEVTVHSGVVTLEGTVRQKQDRRIAEDVVEEIFGVKEVDNKLKVKREAQQPGRGEEGGGREMQPPEKGGRRQRRTS